MNNGPTWQKSSYCGSNACVEVARTPDGVLIRDTKDPAGDPLAFPAGAWRAFLTGIKAGEFDR